MEDVEHEKDTAARLQYLRFCSEMIYATHRKYRVPTAHTSMRIALVAGNTGHVPFVNMTVNRRDMDPSLRAW